MKSRPANNIFTVLKRMGRRLASPGSGGHEDTAMRLYSGAGIAFLTQLSGYALAYLANVLYARWMGPTEYGIFSYISAWTLLLSTLAALEFPTVLLRFASVYVAKSDWASLRGLLKTSRLTVCLSGIGVAILGTMVSAFLLTNHNSPYAFPLAVGAWSIPLWSLIYLHTAMGRVFEKIMTAYLPPRMLKPVLLLLFGALYVSTGRVLTGAVLLEGTIMVLAIVLAIQWLSMEKAPQIRRIRKSVPVVHSREWFHVAFNVLVVSGVFILLQQTNTLLLGFFLAPAQVALYSAAAKTTQLMGMPALAMGAYAVPMFAALYARQDVQGLQAVLYRTVIWSFWPSVLGAVILSVGAPFFLGLFGPAFQAAAPAVVVLALGGLINAGGGSALMLMQVTGHQREAAGVIGSSALAGLFFSIAGIYFFGITGAAIATVLTSAIWVTRLNLMAFDRIGVHPSILYAFTKHNRV